MHHPGIAYGYKLNTGTVVKANAPALTSLDCLEQCNLESSCLYWYYGGGNCRLLSDDGKGGEVADGRSYGKKHSNPSKIILFIQIHYYKSSKLRYNILLS